MKNKNYILSILVILIFWQCQPDKTDIYLIGDSTMANKPLEGNPERGWGQMFHEFFKDNVTVHNHAVNGRSTRSFIDEGRWAVVLDSLKPVDYVFIQFGHNDQKDYDSTRYAAPHGAYKDNLERFVKETRDRKAVPILLTAIMRRRFDENGNFYDTHGDYPDVVREVAAARDVPVIDLHKSSRKLIEHFGEEKSKDIFLWIKPGEFERFPDGKEDNTHFSEYGARIIACLVANDLDKRKIPLKKYLIENLKKCY